MRCRSHPIALTLLTALAAATALAAEDTSRDRRRTPVVEVFERNQAAVVNISTTRVIRPRWLQSDSPFDDAFEFDPRRRPRREVHSVGSGAVIHEDGYIVTNAHVVAQASDISVGFADGTDLPAEIIAVDPDHDLAVVQVQAPRPLTCCRLAESGDILIGETVIAIGNPLGYQHTVTTGIVSAVDRELTFRGNVTYRGLIQTDAPINPGNSGGPLLNVNGELIGINSAIRGDAQNIGFAIPVGQLWELLPRLLDVEQRQRVRFGLAVSGPRAEVQLIVPDSPAARADIQPGDRVVAMDDESLRNGIDYYVHLLEHRPGDQIDLRLRRGEREFDATVELEAIPLPDGEALAADLLGIELMEIPAELRRRYHLADHVRLLVKEVKPGSPADLVGMRTGDLIVRLNRVPIRSLRDVGLALEAVEAGEPVMVEGVRLRPLFSWSVSVPTRG